MWFLSFAVFSHLRHTLFSHFTSCSFSSHYFLSHFMVCFFHSLTAAWFCQSWHFFWSVTFYIVYHYLISLFMFNVWLYFKHILSLVSSYHLLLLPQLLYLHIHIFLFISHTFHHSVCPHLLCLLSSHRILHFFILIQSSSIVNTLKSWKISVKNYLCVDEWTFCVMSSV